MTKQEQIIECENKLLKALQDNNIEVTKELIHDNLLFNIPTGQTVTKEMDIANLRSGIMTISKITARDQIISVTEDIAVVAVTIHLKARYAGNLIDGNFRYL